MSSDHTDYYPECSLKASIHWYTTPQGGGPVYMFSAFLGPYALVVLIAIILSGLKSRRSATPVPTEEREVKEKPVP